MATKSEVYWAITGSHGLYLALDWTRREAIRDHCAKLGKTWAYCRKKGDRAVLVRVAPLMTLENYEQARKILRGDR